MIDCKHYHQTIYKEDGSYEPEYCDCVKEKFSQMWCVGCPLKEPTEK